MSPMGQGLLTAIAALAAAAILFGVAVMSNVVAGEGGLDGPCKTPAEEGSSMRSRSTLWPPRTECVVTRPSGEITRTVHEWPWVPAALIGAVAAAAAAAGVGALREARLP